MKVISWIAQRLSERSTWLGIIGIVTAAGVALTPEQTAAIATAGAGIASAVMVFTSDMTKPS